MPLKFAGIPLVWIKLSNGPTDEDTRVRAELKQFLWDNNIFPAVRPGGSGPDWQSNGYAPGDARKIIQWLKEHGAEVDPSVLTS